MREIVLIQCYDGWPCSHWEGLVLQLQREIQDYTTQDVTLHVAPPRYTVVPPTGYHVFLEYWPDEGSQWEQRYNYPPVWTFADRVMALGLEVHGDRSWVGERILQWLEEAGQDPSPPRDPDQDRVTTALTRWERESRNGLQDNIAYARREINAQRGRIASYEAQLAELREPTEEEQAAVYRTIRSLPLVQRVNGAQGEVRVWVGPAIGYYAGSWYDLGSYVLTFWINSQGELSLSV